MARTKPGAERRSDLLDAAEALVLRAGVDSLTVDDVTSGAGVAKGTFYLHFANKNELVSGLRDRYVHRFVDAQREAARGAGDPVERVERWFLAGITEYLADVRLHDLLFHNSARPEQSTPNLAVDALADLLGEVRAALPDPRATAVVLYHAMHGISDHVVHFPDERDRMLTEAGRICRVLVTVPELHLSV
ncbi:TetR/AcrR family transcriptional regulator [Actinosynnema sp. NPDC023587]|uniref:TetR/AcrR family transcriptional regulator n=1 Tax=Actinosynnema sp. NPDC023587 TaxID=3154695 RepID=UPI0033F1E950